MARRQSQRSPIGILENSRFSTCRTSICTMNHICMYTYASLLNSRCCTIVGHLSEFTQPYNRMYKTPVKINKRIIIIRIKLNESGILDSCIAPMGHQVLQYILSKDKIGNDRLYPIFALCTDTSFTLKQVLVPFPYFS